MHLQSVRVRKLTPTYSYSKITGGKYHVYTKIYRGGLALQDDWALPREGCLQRFRYDWSFAHAAETTDNQRSP
jgi:hypothetical protein